MKKMFFYHICMVAVLFGLVPNIYNIYYVGFIVPAVMFLSGVIMYEARKYPNCIVGYKTGMSMKNQDTWHFANQYGGMLYIKWSMPLFIVSEFIMFFLKPSPAIAEIMLLIQIIPVLAVIPFTEKKLNKIFDWKGNRRE